MLPPFLPPSCPPNLAPPQLTKEESILDLASHTALELHNRVRAFAGWPGTSIGLILEDEGAGEKEGAQLKRRREGGAPPLTSATATPTDPPHILSLPLWFCCLLPSLPSLQLLPRCPLAPLLSGTRCPHHHCCPSPPPPHLSGTREEIELKVCRARVMQGSAAAAVSEAAGELQPEPSLGQQQLQWGPGDTLLLPCKGGTVLEVRGGGGGG